MPDGRWGREEVLEYSSKRFVGMHAHGVQNKHCAFRWLVDFTLQHDEITGDSEKKFRVGKMMRFIVVT